MSIGAKCHCRPAPVSTLLFAVLALVIAFAGSPTVAPAAEFKIGYAAYQRGDFATAAKEWLALAKAGHTKA